jgi:pimeloyl-[acyl-carrier protein] methyl ester esterase
MVTAVLLPGMDGSGKFFSDFVSCLGANVVAKVVSYPKNEQNTYAELCQLVEKELPKDDPYIILSESFSGPIGISLAAKSPPGLLGLFLCCTFARNPVTAPKILSAGLPFLPVWSKLVWLAAPFLLGPNAPSRVISALEAELGELPAKTLKSRIYEVLNVDVARELSSIDVPILYMQAKQDRIVSKAAARYMLKVQPSMKIVEIDGPHLLLQREPKAGATMVMRFIEDASAAFNSSLHTGAMRRR